MKQIEVKRKQIEYLSKALEIVLFLMIKKKMGLEGSGFFLIPLMIFVIIWTFVGECLPDVLSKIIKIRRNKGQIKSIRYIHWYAFIVQIILGLIGTIIMLTVGTYLGENVFGCPYASLMIWVLSPLLFLRGMSSLLLGYCAGEGFELPAVITCLLRVAVIYAFGVILGATSGEYGVKVSTLLKEEKYISMYVGQGWCLAMDMAELVIILFLFFSFLGCKRSKKKDSYEATKVTTSFQGYVSAAFINKVYSALVIFVEIFPIFYGMMQYYKLIGADAAKKYGGFFVGYLSICIICIRLLSAIAVPFWGRVSSLMRQDEVRLGRVCFHSGIHLIVSLGLILCACVTTMPTHLGALAGFTSPDLGRVVAQGSAFILFASLGFYFSRMLIKFRKSMISVGIGILSDIVFVMVFSMIWADGRMDLLAITYAGMIAYGTYAILLGAISIRMIGGRVDWVKNIVLPAFLAFCIGVIQALCVKFLGNVLESIYIVLLVGGVGFVVYWCVLLLLNNYSSEELSVMPFGKVIKSFGSLFGIY